MKTKVKEIATVLLTSECIYRYKNRSGWILGHNNGIVSYIEDHRHDLSISTERYASTESLVSCEFIERIISVKESSSDKIEYEILVEPCEGAYMPDGILLAIAKSQTRFGLIGVVLHDIDISNAILLYFEGCQATNQEVFKLM
jgi:hypothetical protein